MEHTQLVHWAGNIPCCVRIRMNFKYFSWGRIGMTLSLPPHTDDSAFFSWWVRWATSMKIIFIHRSTLSSYHGSHTHRLSRHYRKLYPALRDIRNRYWYSLKWIVQVWECTVVKPFLRSNLRYAVVLRSSILFHLKVSGLIAFILVSVVPGFLF